LRQEADGGQLLSKPCLALGRRTVRRYND